MLERLLHSLGEVFRYGMKFDKIFDAFLHLFEFFCALIHLDHDRCDVTKYGGTDQRYSDKIEQELN